MRKTLWQKPSTVGADIIRPWCRKKPNIGFMARGGGRMISAPTAVALILLIPTIAHAQTTPSPVQTSIGTACTGKANSADFDAIAQCNGTTMGRAPLQAGKVTAPPYASTTCNADKAGMIQWNGNMFQACDGTTWMKMVISIYDPSCDGDMVAPGTICDDGTLYAGRSIEDNAKMFVTPCDEGRIWDEANKRCFDQPYALGFAWHAGAAGAGVVTGANSMLSGQSNTAKLVALGTSSPGPYLPAWQCDQSTANGHTDWYLPAANELETIISNLNMYGYHWSSTEIDAERAWFVNQGTRYDAPKTNSSWVRCARKG